MAHRGEAHVVDPPRPPLDRQGGQSRHRQHARAPRSVRGHSRHADRRGDDGGGADGPRVAPSRAERRRRQVATPRIAAQAPAGSRREVTRAARRVRRSGSRTKRLAGLLPCRTSIVAPRAAARERERDAVACRDLPRVGDDLPVRGGHDRIAAGRAPPRGLRCARFCASARQALPRVRRARARRRTLARGAHLERGGSGERSSRSKRRRAIPRASRVAARARAARQARASSSTRAACCAIRAAGCTSRRMAWSRRCSRDLAARAASRVSSARGQRCQRARASATPVGHDERRRGRRRGRAHVGDEVADGEVGLVAHAGHDRQRRREHRARDGLLVERPQVLDRAAAARDDQHVDFARARWRCGSPARSRPAASRALDRRRIEHDAQRRPAARAAW